MEWSKETYADGELAILLPADGARPRGYVVYVHGGGFCCTRFFHYKQSVTFLCRAGFAVAGPFGHTLSRSDSSSSFDNMKH